jgi:hypothetical protein
MSYVYAEEHSLLDLEYLDRGNDAVRRFTSDDSTDFKRESLLGYVYARIPEEFWSMDKLRAPSRQLLKELVNYSENASQVRSLGLGITFLGRSFGGRTQALYSVCKELVDKGFSCFVISCDEFVYLAKEAWNDFILKRELDARFSCDFFVLAEVFDGSDIAAAVRQDLVARCSLRRSRCLPMMFSVGLDVKSLSDIPTDSFIGKLLLPFARVNKPIVTEEIGDVDNLYVERWQLLNGSR